MWLTIFLGLIWLSRWWLSSVGWEGLVSFSEYKSKFDTSVWGKDFHGIFDKLPFLLSGKCVVEESVEDWLENSVEDS